ncbi:MAG TPA: RIP metalloprotease RseP [Spirochaetota bacterium]|nr:RIP metalloprotease RseP [Spirochaetota bacterium]HOS33034.1 RIP metalloprotease RseP [Spirochaetota bacterium]HOS55537.1 RIP metalloprotease RseP [Spirochaetota bacterium]HPK62596.1 RIP metalloprotease RseP [Spirochaetota bacterium]HQF78090.1 RIP metalloprotease RseP [Spirochaetota bacterium]
MELFLVVVIAVLGFGILVFFHELGHFLTAKLFKIKVEKFAIGWGPAVVGFQGKETYYQLSVFPVGGFCKFKGDEMSRDFEEKARDKDSFYGVSPVKRLLVAFSGPFMNYIIAVIFLSLMSLGSYKEIKIPNKILLVEDYLSKFGVVELETPAKRGGLRSGDVIVQMNDKKIESYEDINKYMVFNGKKPVEITVERDGNFEKFTVNPEWDPSQMKAIVGVYYYLDPIIKIKTDKALANYLKLQDNDKIIGIDDDYEHITDIVVNNFLQTNFALKKSAILRVKRGDENIDVIIEFNKLNRYLTREECYLDFQLPEVVVGGKNIFGAIADGFRSSNEIISISAIGLYSMIFKPKKDFSKQVGGPIRIGEIIGKLTYEGFKDGIWNGLRNFFSIVSYISLALAFFNLLPLPAVDGGHIILNIYEILTRKQISLKVLSVINFVGFAILITLSIMVAFLDVSSLIKGG